MPEAPIATLTRSPAIDLLRGASMIWIVGIWHGLDYVADLPGHQNGATTAFTVVILALFVLVSGTLAGGRAIALDRRGLFDFLSRRFLRIYPPFLVAASLFALLRIAPLPALGKAALLVSPLHGPQPMTLWFVAMLCLFILATPTLVQWRHHPRRLLAAAVAGTVGLAVLSRTIPGVDVRLAMYFPAYCAGIAVAQGHLRVPLLLLAIAFVLGVALAWPLTNALPGQLRAMPMAVAGALLILMVARRWEAAIPDWRIVPRLGAAAYFMYLFHRPVLELVMRLQTNRASGLLLLWLVGLPIIVLLSAWGQSLYDRACRAIDRAPADARAVGAEAERRR